MEMLVASLPFAVLKKRGRRAERTLGAYFEEGLSSGFQYTLRGLVTDAGSIPQNHRLLSAGCRSLLRQFQFHSDLSADPRA